MRVISTFGSDALAGYTIGIRTVIFAILPAWGLSNAAATMVGQALGAGKPDRAEESVWTAGKYNAIVLGLVGAVFVVFAPQIVAIYTSDPAVAPYAISCLRIVSTGFVFFAYGLVLTQSFNGAGRHLDADVDQSGLLLVLADSAGVVSGDLPRRWARKACSSR